MHALKNKSHTVFVMNQTVFGKLICHLLEKSLFENHLFFHMAAPLVTLDFQQFLGKKSIHDYGR